jgi:hypothetical protein
LVYGTILSEMPFEGINARYMIFFYAAALFFQKWSFDTRFMDERSPALEADRIMFAGEAIETDAEAEVEKRALDRVLQLSVQVKLRIATVAMIGAFVLLTMNHSLHVHFSLLLQVLTALMLLPALTPNHFILPLLVNLLAVGYSYVRSPQPDLLQYSGYLFLFLASILGFGNVLREIRQSRAHPISIGALTGRSIGTAFHLGMSYLLLTAVVDHIIPHPYVPKPGQPSDIGSRVDQIKTMIGKAVPGLARPELGTPKPGGRGSVEIPNLAAGKEMPKLTPEEIRAAQDYLKSMAQKMRDEGLPEPVPGATGGPRLPDPSPEQSRAAYEAVLERMREAIRKEEGAPGGGEREPGSVPKPERSVSWPDLDQLLDALNPFLLATFVVGVGVYFRRRLKKKADPKTDAHAQLARLQRQEIQRQMRDLSRRKLSPREEVIARYDLFLKIMELARTPRESYLPPQDFALRVQYVHPRLEAQASCITAAFSDVFYGGLDVQPKLVSAMRGAVGEVFEYFAK